MLYGDVPHDEKSISAVYGVAVADDLGIQVFTGIALIIKETDGTEKILDFSVCTEVSVCSMNKEQIEAYSLKELPSSNIDVNL